MRVAGTGMFTAKAQSAWVREDDFHDREDAGLQLSKKLALCRHWDLEVLGFLAVAWWSH